MSVYYVIPARRNSKGLPFKNRKLLQYTLKTLSVSNLKRTIITTDDEWILDKIKLMENVRGRERPIEFSQDDTSHKLVLKDVIDNFSLRADDIIVYLYLTYPQRNKQDIKKALQFYFKNNARSLLCRKEITTSPYLMMYEAPNNGGRKVIDCELWRRQDYKMCFERSHFVVIFRVDELDKLNDFLWNEDTVFCRIDSPLDIDTNKDIKRFFKERRHV